jgi:cyclic beta-1,2-glucan synthetase
MAHHQGMIMLSLCNFLCREAMIRRFHADPRIETVELLLQERTPTRAVLERPRPREIGVVHPVHTAVSLTPWGGKPGTPFPQAHFLSNGDYNLMITSSGGGFSRWSGVDLTRWRADSTLDEHGSWVYIKDHQSNQLWSVGLQPTLVQPNSQTVMFHPHAVEFVRTDGDISTRTEIVIAPEADVEIRCITLTNHGTAMRELELTSYAEVILSLQSADQRHPAYNKLFIESEFIAKDNILLFRRRPRSAQEKPVYLAHFVVGEDGPLETVGYETDRDRFIGRGRTQRAPAALQPGSELSNSTSTLDPIFALQVHVAVPEYESHQLAFVTLAAPSRREALELANRFSQWRRIRKTFDEARVKTEAELTQLDLSSQQLEQIQKLLSALFYPGTAMRPSPSTIASNTLGQPGLWPFAISGDYPILLVRFKNGEEFGLLNELFCAHAYWRRRGLMIDLVVLNQHETSYDQSIQGKMYRILSRTNSDDWLGKRGGIFILREDQMSEQERILIETSARVVLDDAAGSLANQLQKLDHLPVRLPHVVPILPLLEEADISSLDDRPTNLRFDNGLGGFTRDGREYIICLDRGQWTPAPWVNVIANPEFGFLVSEAGMGCTWSINSGENRLTPWRNDPVCDPPSEAVYLRDEDTGQVWSPTPLPVRADAPYIIHHGTGYTLFEHRSHQLKQEMKVFAAPDAPIKIVQLKLENTTSRVRRINITYYAEWVLGTIRENMAQYIVPEFASSCFALLAHNPYNQDFGKRVAFLAATRELQGLTTDRAEFLGPLGSYARPEALERVGLTARAQAGGDPCAAIQLLLWLAPNETKEVTFLLGQGEDRADALRLITHYQNLENVTAAWESLHGFWDELLGSIQVKTPDEALDLLINRWLPYQALACRIWGRTAFYQSGGAYGYRDQLQDVLAFAYTRPEITRGHILNAARHQFEEGDVLHWWHPPADKGIRTRITDNLLWLPYVTAQYVHSTGDYSILDEQISFLSAEPLKDGEHERYGDFPVGGSGTLYEHCRRALEKGMTVGKHGLPLMGEGDWNDGMNRVGVNGAGESVWLGWFLYSTLQSFAEICKEEDAIRYREQAGNLQSVLEASAWDGEWYRRAYYDNGQPLGSIQNHDCQIDSISQSWAVISGAADPERAHTAMESLNQLLVRRDEDLILLLKPPFNRTIHDPGYIKGYQPGIRENGGQYTHAAIWAIWAFAELGQGDRVAELFRLINPIYHSDTPEKMARYRVEPYIIAADVCSASSQAGRGGWTWYTGSASWMYRLGVEKILGLHRSGSLLKINPCIPRDWRKVEIHYRFGGATYHIYIENSDNENSRTMSLELDGRLLDVDHISLMDDGNEHKVHAMMK